MDHPTRSGSAPDTTLAVRQLITGGQVNQIVGAVAAFGVPDLLANGPRHIADLGEALALDPHNLYRLLRAAATVGVLDEIEPRTFSLTAVGQRLRSDVPLSMRDGAITTTDPVQWLPWLRLRETIQTGRPQIDSVLGSDIFSYLKSHPEEGEHFSSWMGQRSELLIAALLESYDFSRFQLAVDVGGAYGHLLTAILQNYPQLHGIVFDQPEVVMGAPPVLEANGVADRCEAVGGDFFRGVPAGADLYLLKSVIHDWPDDAAVKILTTVRDAMNPTGSVIIIDFALPADGERAYSQLMDLTMMVFVGARERAIDDFGDLLRAAGLRLTRTIPIADHMLLAAQRA